MTYTLDETIMANDLSFDCKTRFADYVQNRIKDDEQLMERIKTHCEEEKKEYDEAGGSKLELKDLINLHIEELADEATDSVKIRCDVELEFNEEKL